MYNNDLNAHAEPCFGHAITYAMAPASRWAHNRSRETRRTPNQAFCRTWGCSESPLNMHHVHLFNDDYGDVLQHAEQHVDSDGHASEAGIPELREDKTMGAQIALFMTDHAMKHLYRARYMTGSVSMPRRLQANAFAWTLSCVIQR
jgi:hypothetical protein